MTDTIVNLYIFSIFQYHNNDTTNNNINVHLSVIDSLRVPPLLAYDLSNLGVILLSVSMLLSAASLSNLATASLFLYNFGRYCEIRKLSGSHNFMTHSPKIGLNASIFMRIEISRILHNSFSITWGNSGSHDFSVNTNYQLIYIERTLYTSPIGEKYFYFEMNIHMLRLDYK